MVHICHPLSLSVSFSPPGQKEPPYLTEAGREAFDQLYRLWEGEMRNILSTQTPSPLLPLPLDCQSQLVKDVLNVLIGVSSGTFPLNEVEQLNMHQENTFVMRADP